ncbi:DAK2 domain-containing protein [Pseudonocardia sp. ICBG1293]|uniref:DAK2 domain-containing protein n=1 Tax=Pseudonocardia sp. ICBG1293 TaxID=2844382 RepID=UPI001CCE1221|nr:DAK2 domain-containing protein [Pseudonocardia sp. ICBG1293]
MASPFDPALLRRWIDAAAERLTAGRAEIDRINVFPVADHDTGSNLLLTARAAASAPLDGGVPVADPVAEDVRPVRAAAALAAAAVRGARGNSGLILSQLFRGLAEELAAAAARRPNTPAGELLAGALRRAAGLAAVAVSAPRPGTALTVLDAAAAAVAARVAAGAATGPSASGPALARVAGLPGHADPDGGGPDTTGALAEAARVAADAARAALARATGRPPELVRAGVVDAGGLGLVVVLDALVAAAGGDPGPPPSSQVGTPGPASAVTADGELVPWVPQPVYEVTYWLPGPDPAALETLRARLAGLGDSVGLAGDGGGGVMVHVHTTEAGPAVEAGLAVVRPSGIRIEALPPAPPTRDRAVLLMIESSGAGALARAAGGNVLVADPDPTVDEVLAAIRATCAEHVVVLPCATHRRTVGETAAQRVRFEGIDVVVVPASSVLQGLAALAVHDPARRAPDDVVAMAEAAAATRTGGLAVAEAEALTWAGPCRPGEILGISDGEVVLIAPDLAVGALWLAHRMLTPGGELVTVLLGSAAPDDLGERLAEDLRRTHPEVDVVVHRGEQGDYPLVLGVE